MHCLLPARILTRIDHALTRGVICADRHLELAEYGIIHIVGQVALTPRLPLPRGTEEYAAALGDLYRYVLRQRHIIQRDRQGIVPQVNHEMVTGAPMKALLALVWLRTICHRLNGRIADLLRPPEILLGAHGRRCIASKRLVLAHHCVAPILRNGGDGLTEDHRDLFSIELPRTALLRLLHEEHIVHQ